MVIIGNHPFGRRGATALKFIQKASNTADTIAFILPVLFRKYSVQKNVPKNLKLIYDEKLPVDSFYLAGGKEYILNTTFQIWTRLELRKEFIDLRIKEAPSIKHPEIGIWQYNATKTAKKVFDNDFDFAVLRQGYQGFEDIKLQGRRT